MADDPFRYFRVEARELLDGLSKGALEIERGAPVIDAVARLLRLAHTLKGAARVVKQRGIADLAHALEDALAPYRGSQGPMARQEINAILQILDDIGRQVGALAPAAGANATTVTRAVSEESLRSLRADVGEMDHLLDGVVEAQTRLAALRGELGALERARNLTGILSARLALPRSREGLRPVAGIADETVRSLAEELRSEFAALDRGLAVEVEQVDRELRQVREAAERLRLVPVSALFTSLERAARDVAQAQGKRVIFEGRGGDVRLDAHVLATAQGALLHVVRNAVAHGLESDAARRSAGKPPDGRVTLEVVRRGRRVAFLCRDDGQGVDLVAVRQAAQRKGMPGSEIQKLRPDELLRMLLRGGISTTSGAVTELSGRGVGLDVVREAAEHLGGDVTVKTEPGRGTEIELVVPVSLSSLEGLVVETAGVAATIPLDAVRRGARLSSQDIARTLEGDTVVHEGKVIPFIPLSRALAVNSTTRVSRSWSTVIVEGSTGTAAIGVDRLLGTANVVIRPLPGLALASAVVAGASLDAEGNPRLVLDPDALVAEATRAAGPESGAEANPGPILVIDDSLTTRMLEQSILESEGYQVDLAVSGEEALDKAHRKRYSLFLVDVEMPGIDGFTFIERTRADAALRDIPCILVTSRASPEDQRRGQDAGARAYVVKSAFDQVDFLERIRELLR